MWKVAVLIVAVLPVAALLGLAVFWPIVERQWQNGSTECADKRGRIEP